MRKIAVVTGTRAEYGLLYWLMRDIEADSQLELQLLVTGMHLSPEFGCTYQQIEDDGFRIDEKIEMLLSSDSAVGVAKSVGVGVIGFADSLRRLQPDCLIILGDRYEALAAAQTALLMRIPVAHIHGGEITEGAYDDAIRHAITKFSHVHFTATEDYRRRVIQLGEQPNKVFNVGAPGLEYLRRTTLMGFDELSSTLGGQLRKPFFLATYHPVTLDTQAPAVALKEMTKALDRFPAYQVLITYPNSDNSGRELIERINLYANRSNGRVIVTPSLGQIRYLSAMQNSELVIGNSSSGIIEAPSLKVPTVNIGPRQLGRIMARSVINSPAEKDQIIEAIGTALRYKKNGSNEIFSNPYGDGDVSGRLISTLKSIKINSMKRFFNLEKTV